MIFEIQHMQSGGDPLVLCFVDFLSPAHAATAMDAYKVMLARYLIFLCLNQTGLGSLIMSSGFCPFIFY